MTITHIEDGGEINKFVNDEGETLLVCRECQAKWVNGVDPAQTADMSTRMSLVDSLERHRTMFAELGVEVDEAIAKLRGV